MSRLVLSCFFVVCCVTITAQEAEEHVDATLTIRIPQIVISVDFDGRAVVAQVDTITVSEFSESADLLRLARVQEELDLVSEQRSQLKEFLADMEQKRNDLIAKATRLNDAQARQRLRVEALQISEGYKKKFDELLLPHQQRILRQIRQRIVFRRIGPARFLKQLAKDHSAFDISSDELERIERNIEVMRGRIIDESRRQLERGLKELIMPLGDEQKIQLASYVDLIATRQSNLDLFLAQLDEGNREEWSFQFNRIFDRMVLYSIQPDGVATKLAKTVNPQLAKAEQLVPYMQWIDSLRDGEWGSKLNVNDAQREKLNGMAVELLIDEMEIAEILNNAEDPLLAIELVKDRQTYHCRQTRVGVLNLLSEAQHSRLENLYIDAAVKRFGLFSELTVGELGKLVRVTGDQKEEIKKAAATVREQLRKTAIELEAEYFNTFVSCLEEEHQHLLWKVIGDRLEHVSTSMTELLWGLAAR
jgi:hypothetical protein